MPRVSGMRELKLLKVDGSLGRQVNRPEKSVLAGCALGQGG